MSEPILDDLDLALREEANEKAIAATVDEKNLDNDESHTNQPTSANPNTTENETAPLNSTEDSNESSADDSSDESTSSSDSSDSSSDSDSDSEADDFKEFVNSDGEIDESTEIPHTKNEILRAEIPKIPAELSLTESTPVELVGTLHTAGDFTVVIKATGSARYRVLTDNAVLVLGGPQEPKIPIGVLYETFGPVDQPFYVVKFPEDADLEEFRRHKQCNVYQVVNTGQYVRTENFKAKGTDASNFNDEEVPLEEQEFSDDEQEMLAKSKTKKRKRNKKPSAKPTEPARAPAAPPAFPVPPMMMMPPEMAQQWYQFQQFQMSQGQFNPNQFNPNQFNQFNSNQHPNQHPNQYPNQHPNQYPNQYQSQYPNQYSNQYQNTNPSQSTNHSTMNTNPSLPPPPPY